LVLGGLNKRSNVRNFPKAISNSSGHCGRHPQFLVYADEIVIHEVERHGISVVLNLLAEGVRQIACS
jgi:hypothetical protein